jgi:hypothetical protein
MAWLFQGVLNAGEPPRVACARRHAASVIALLPTVGERPQSSGGWWGTPSTTPALADHQLGLATTAATRTRSRPSTPHTRHTRTPLRAGLQILLSVFAGWLCARLKLVDPEVMSRNVNLFAMKAAYPAFILHLLGVKTDLRDGEAWR